MLPCVAVKAAVAVVAATGVVLTLGTCLCIAFPCLGDPSVPQTALPSPNILAVIGGRFPAFWEGGMTTTGGNDGLMGMAMMMRMDEDEDEDGCSGTHPPPP